ncbi:hypothetical protein Enr13x_46160 [Stieleria neptunia]|uniref:Uncharacterized protein n=1 Tax=Stieleria neptunia TaxID=2527979 RepID=A0A518HV64_9BACT|nr:hypothetical protein [Stieleria neptunia]QDV44746.1 hypothetical protein Enr13x_46160 [Stieleria neptunia]
MKMLVWLSATFTVLLVLASGLTGAPPSDSDAAADKPAAATPSCCLDKAAAADTGKESDAKPACCLAASDSEDAPQCSGCLNPTAAAGCGKCADAGNKAANVDATAKEAGKSCQFCSDDECKQECTDCAAVRTDAETVAAKQPQPLGKGAAMRGGPGMGRGHGHDAQHDIDHEDFFFLIEHKETIRRTVKNLPNGIETLTESDDEDVAARIQKHVESMYDRMEHVNPIRMRDPLFREIFANAKKIKMDVEHTEHGVLVRETSKDAYVAKLLQEHAKVVSLFIKNGYSELPKNHAPPKR